MAREIVDFPMKSIGGFSIVNLNVYQRVNGCTYPQMNGLFPWENPIKMDDDWGYPQFRKPPN
jgi:hypothetical protein